MFLLNNLLKANTSVQERNKDKLENSRLKRRCMDMVKELDSTKAVTAFLVKNLECSRVDMNQLKTCIGLKENKILKMSHVSSMPYAEPEGPNYLQKLPPQVVKIILEYLTEPEDLTNCIGLSPVFNKALASNHILILKLAFPYICSVLSLVEILELRSVCHGWEAVVDDFLQKLNLPKAYVDSNSISSGVIKKSFPSSNFKTTVVQLGTVGKMARLTDAVDFTNPSYNPFVGRSVTFFNKNKHYNFWLLSVPTFLEKFGRHIWDSKLVLVDEVEPSLLGGLWSSLKRMPNLKKLELVTVDYDGIWKGCIGNNLLPDLPNLVAIQMNAGPPKFFKAVMNKYCEQLQELSIIHPDDGPLILLGLNVLPKPTLQNGFSCLQSLTIVLRGKTDTLKQLMTLRLLNCPLKTLSVTVADVAVNAEEILGLLQNFRRSLQALQVSLLSVTVKAAEGFCSVLRLGCFEGSVVLPHLKELCLKNVIGSLNFLTLLPSLQRLNIGVSREHAKLFWRKREHEVIGIHGYINGMYHSNIWRLLPSLSYFTFSEPEKCVSYSRQGYEYTLQKSC